MVVCPQPLAASAGHDILARDGNAIDAIVATAFAQAVVDPLRCGIGGGGALHYYSAHEARGIVLNCAARVGSGPVPSGWASEYIGREEAIGRFALRTVANQIGYQAIMVPGFVRGCWTAWHQFGSKRFTWSELMAPAIHLAREGFALDAYAGRAWQDLDDQPGFPRVAATLRATPEAAGTFLQPDGSVFREGDWLRQPDLTRTLERLAEAGGDDFYTGEIACRIAADLQEHGGAITADDLRTYTVPRYPPLRAGYRDTLVTVSATPSSGPPLLQMLQVLNHFDPRSLGHNSPVYVDTFARIQRAIFVDFARQKGRQRPAAEAAARAALRPRHVAAIAARIQRGDRIDTAGGLPEAGTTHLSCVDGAGNVAGFTHSIGASGGSGVVSPGLGFLFNNFVGHFNPLPGQPNSLGTGKRVGGGAPAIVFRDGEPIMTLGAPGGSRLLTSTAQVLVNAIDFQMETAAAVSVPRFHSEERQRVLLEPVFPEETAQALRALGNDIRRTTTMSLVQAIRRHPDSDVLEFGADPRGGRGVGFVP
jgi:gamma-glutamyltranspeptidase / glutathione hydrolase